MGYFRKTSLKFCNLCAESIPTCQLKRRLREVGWLIMNGVGDAFAWYLGVRTTGCAAGPRALRATAARPRVPTVPAAAPAPPPAAAATARLALVRSPPRVTTAALRASKGLAPVSAPEGKQKHTTNQPIY